MEPSRDEQDTLRSGGVTLHYRVEGPKTAPWLIFSNSLMTDLSLWDEQVICLRDRYQILRYDQRGHGNSSVPEDACTFDILVDDVVALMDKLAITSASFVGVSMGAVTGLRLAARFPHRIRRLVACDGQWATPPGGAVLWEERIAMAKSNGMDALVEPTISRWFTKNFVASDAPSLQKVRSMIAGTSQDGFENCARALCQYDFRQSISELKVPTLFLVGACDGTLPQVMHDMHKSVKESGYIQVTDSGHLPNIERPVVFNRMIEGFLANRLEEKEV